MTRIDYFRFLTKLLGEHELTLSVDEIGSRIYNCILSGNSIWILGNGGSASTAEHLETDMSFIKHENLILKIKATALTANSALISAVANDIGFENIFSHQLQRKAERGDLCIVISASGNSLNLINATNVAKQMGLTTIGLLGFNGGKLAGLLDFSIIIKTETGQYGPVEDMHLAICHAVSENLLGKLRVTKKV